MITTVEDFLNTVLRKLNVIASGEEAEPEELNDSLDTLNMMLQSWTAEGIVLQGITAESLALTGASSYTWGAGGDLATAPPASILHAAIFSGAAKVKNVDIIGPKDYQRILAPNTGGTPDKIWLNPGYPLATFSLYPVGDSSLTLKVNSIKTITSFATLAETFIIPPHAVLAVKQNLTIELAPEFGVQVSPMRNREAEASKARLLSMGVIDALMNMTEPTPFAPEDKFDVRIID